MSLHIGNLSSNIHQDDLHRVFRRFGRCTVQVKDKYGFVVYDYHASAEKALRTLRSTMICGRAITLSWSNRQPRAMPRFATGGKLYEPLSRSYIEKGNADRRLHSYGQRTKGMDFKKADSEIRTGTFDFIDDSKHYNGESSHTSLTDRRGIEGSGNNLLKDNRWAEQVVDPSNENYLEKGMDFDRYEPYQSDGQKELDEQQGESPVDNSPSTRKTQDRTGIPYKLEKSRYLCGDVSQKMSKCPLELKRHVPRRGLRPSDDTVPLRNESDRDASTFKRQRGSPSLEISNRGKGKEFRDTKRNRKNYASHDKNHERARGPSTSSICSDYTSSRSQSPSRSVKSLSQLPSLSKEKLVPSEKISLSSSSLGSSSPSHRSGSETFKLRSTLRPMSPTSALSPVELNGKASPSPNQILKSCKGSVGNAVGFAPSMNLFEEETLVTSDTGPFTAGNIISTVENKWETKSSELEHGDLKKDLSEKNTDHCHSGSSDSHELLESDGGDQVVDNSYLQSVKGVRDSQNEEHVVAPEPSFLRFNASNSLRMSSEEACTLLKHYGLQHREENDKESPVEIYFGSARLWPWEIIYYRRLKKGLISTENYSRRIAQNEEFCIVDKYIRSSSGWGEMEEDNL